MSAVERLFWDTLSRPFLTFGPLVTPQDIQDDVLIAHSDYYEMDERESLARLAAFMTGFLTTRHDALGRTGIVCPFTPGALQRSLMRITASRIATLDDDAVRLAMTQLRAVFLTKSETENQGRAEVYRSISVAFPRLPAIEGAALIERVQKAEKLTYLRHGLMLGEFYPTCPAPGLHNDDFRPLQAPELCLSVRHMTEADAPFMLDDDRYRSAFLDRFGAAGEKSVRQALRKRGCPHDTGEVSRGDRKVAVHAPG